jgi:hypothetical protein
VDIGLVVATTEYELPNGRKLTLNIGRPRQNAGEHWFCPWHLIGGDGTVHAANDVYGADSGQALQLAIPDIDAAVARLQARSRNRR